MELLLLKGLGISIVGIIFVFIGLVLISILISFIGIFANRRKKKIFKDVVDIKSLNIPNDVSAAIAMALYLNRLFFEEEDREITIKKVTLPFSPWVTRGRNQMVSISNAIFRRRK
jgi:Na+-transporting methylmalonyl-CoA/oxaloacetate decarboxylase gamma subunit